MNYLALLGWAPSGGTRETFTKQELVKEFDLRRVTPSPAIFDMEKLAWLNRHYIKQSPAERIASLALSYFVKTGLAPEKDVASYVSTEEFLWFQKMVELLAPYVDRLEQLPERAAMIFHHDPKKALENSENVEVLRLEKTPAVIAGFSRRIAAENGEVTAERFKAIVNEVKTETGTKGKELFHPIRIAIIGSHSGPEFDKLIPIIEAGSKLELPVHVKSVRERVEEFGKTFAAGKS